MWFSWNHRDAHLGEFLLEFTFHFRFKIWTGRTRVIVGFIGIDTRRVGLLNNLKTKTQSIHDRILSGLSESSLSQA